MLQDPWCEISRLGACRTLAAVNFRSGCSRKYAECWGGRGAAPGGVRSDAERGQVRCACRSMSSQRAHVR